jgi:hypothetical protein
MTPFVAVPVWVLDLGLTQAELTFYVAIARWRINKSGNPHQGFGFPTRPELEKTTGLSKRRVNELLRALEEKGALAAVREEERLVLDFRSPGHDRADQPLDRADQPPTGAEQPPATPISSQEENKKKNKKARADARALPTIDEFFAEHGEMLTGRFPAYDGGQGRQSLREVVAEYLDWQARCVPSKRHRDLRAGCINSLARNYWVAERSVRMAQRAGEAPVLDPGGEDRRRRNEEQRRRMAAQARHEHAEPPMDPQEVRALLSSAVPGRGRLEDEDGIDGPWERRMQELP